MVLKILRRVTPIKNAANSLRYYSLSPGDPRLQIAIVGSGPAGFYTAHRLLQKLPNIQVDLYERLPVPFGLSRFGVAPDHPEVKNCEDTFTETARDARFRFIGNTEVGETLNLKDLRANYNGVVFAYGASEDRTLKIPGEHLNGIHSAREFVGWYNGLPSCRNLEFNLAEVDEVLIIGQGNVALDVGRMLLTPVDKLRHTDICDYALEELSKSRVKRIHIVGRRGPAQSAFTTKEFREMLNLPSAHFIPVEERLMEPLRPLRKGMERARRRLLETLDRPCPTPLDKADKVWSLDYQLAPRRFVAGSISKDLAAVEFDKTRLNQTLPDQPTNFERTGETVTFPAQLAFRSIGYKSLPLKTCEAIGLPFDIKKGVIPNKDSQVIDPRLDEPVAGLYTAGWVKRGPTGVIASTLMDAFDTADKIVSDYESAKHMNTNLIFRGFDGVKSHLKHKYTTWQDWQRIDEIERLQGDAAGKPRIKFASVAEMLKALD